MFSLVHISQEGTHDVCKTSFVHSERGGKYILRNKRRIRVSLICTNDSEKILNDLKDKRNRRLPGLVIDKSKCEVVHQDMIEQKTKKGENTEKTTNTKDKDERSIDMSELRLLGAKRRLFVEDVNGNNSIVPEMDESENESEPFSGDDIVDPDFEISPSKYVISSDEDEDVDKDKDRSGKAPVKKNCCVYCKQLFSKLVPHLERKHTDEVEVRKFMNFPKGSHGRKLIIETLRKEGNFLHAEGKEGIISVRRTNTNMKLKPCPNCKGFYSVTSLRKHFKRCNPNFLQNKRRLLIMSRKLDLGIHPKASYILKNEVFPILREDAVVDQIRQDELVIIYGNKLCEKYKSRHLHKMIRARLRLIGRFLIDIKKEDDVITDFSSIFHPKFFDRTIRSINSVAQLDEMTGKYKSPATAFALGTALKFIANTLVSECIKNGQAQKKKEVQDFLKLLHSELTTAVNKTVSENQLEYKRQKQIRLPSNEDIKKLYYYLTNERRKYLQKCQQNLCKESWIQLAGYTLISMQLFNRRRAGEIEQILLEDFKSHHRINEEDDLFKSLSETSKEAAKQYVRFTIRGKLARGVPVLLHKKIFDCVELLLEKRSEIGVPEQNPYLFGIPHSDKTHEHLNAYNLLVEFSERCGAKEPKTLRGTGLRKHIATQCILLNLKETEVKDLANYMGHAEKVHFDHYRMPIVARDITVMSRLLEKAQGTENLPQDILTRTEASEGENIASTSRTDEDEILSELGEPERTPKKKPLTRLAWITPERYAIKSAFSQHISDNKLPSFKECRMAQQSFPVLKRRSLPQIKAHVSNEIRRKTTIRSQIP